MQAVREHRIGDLRDVSLAMLEVDGSISVIPGHESAATTRVAA
jgi:uncharacterized membrane protein YcaP (DUF421 family)